MFKRSLLLLVLCFSFFLSACVNDVIGQQEVYTVNITYANQPGEPPDLQARRWKELAEEKSNGRLQIELFPSSQLGSEGDVLEMAANGNNIITDAGYDYLSDYSADISLMEAPYLFDEVEDAIYLTETEWFKEKEKELADNGLALVNTNSVSGERHIMTRDLVKTPEDLKGMAIRVPNSPLYITVFRALGASPTPLPLEDLYASLQQGVVDGAENPITVLEGSGTHEVTNHIALTGHIKQMKPWVTGTKVLDNLPDDLVDILQETGYEAAEYGQKLLSEQEQEMLQEFEDRGITINKVENEVFREEVENVLENYKAWSPGLYKDIRSILEERK